MILSRVAEIAVMTAVMHGALIHVKGVFSDKYIFGEQRDLLVKMLSSQAGVTEILAEENSIWSIPNYHGE